MTETDLIHRAEQAKSLLANDLFADALTQIRMEALLGLSDVDPSRTTEILRLQAIVRCTDDIRGFLEAAITRTGANDGGLVMPATRPKANKAN